MFTISNSLHLTSNSAQLHPISKPHALSRECLLTTNSRGKAVFISRARMSCSLKHHRNLYSTVRHMLRVSFLMIFGHRYSALYWTMQMTPSR